MQENAGIENKPRRKRRSREQIAEPVRSFTTRGTNPEQICEDRGVGLSGLSELQRSLKIVRRASEPLLMAV